MSSFFSQASNFASAVSGGVDPRTGLYSVQVVVGSLVGNRNLGPSLPLALSYSPLNTVDMGLGTGVGLGLSTYDEDSGLLVLSSGERYKVLDNGSSVTLRQKKLDTVRFTKDEANNVYRVVHKSGDVEVLTGPGNGYSLKVPRYLMSPAGHVLTFGWDFGSYAQPRLTSVSDESDTLLTVDYDGLPSKVVLHVLPGCSEGYDVELRFANGLLHEVHHLGLGAADPLVWSFSSDVMAGDWGTWLTGVTMPGGMSESVTYDNSLVFPQSCGRAPLPAVSIYRQVPGGGSQSPPITANYTFTDNNFLGGYSDASCDPNLDNLYGVLSSYTYGSTEIRTVGGSTRKITRSYNNYHLLTDETSAQNGFSRTVHTDYYAKIGQSFEVQPAQFQLPAARTVTWTHGTDQRQEITQTSFDDNGNPVSRSDPDGTGTTWTFYPADGSVAGCPADPNGFVRWMKDVTRTPPSTAFEAPVAQQSYEYSSYSVPGSYQSAVPQAARVTSVVVKTGESHFTDGGQTLLTSQAFGYTTSGDDAEFGRLTALTTKEYPDGAASDPFTSRETFGFAVSGERLSQSHAMTTFDQLSVTRSEERSRFTGRLESATDAQGDGVALTYDGLGRVLTRTVNPGTGYAATETHSYEVATSAPFVVTSGAPLTGTGNAPVDRLRVSYDGAGRPFKKERKDVDGDGSWRTIQQAAYDEQGRALSLTSTDWLPDGTQDSQVTETYLYDDWGQICATQSIDGSTHNTQTDPIALTTTSQLLGGGTPVTGMVVASHNLRGEVVKAERFDLQGTSKGARLLERDGWGRVRRETDEVGNTTLFDFDAHGRPSLTTLADGTKVTRTYDVPVAGAQDAQLGAGTTPYGTQVFDGLGRLKTATSGGRSWGYDYTRASDVVPALATMPDGQQQIYTPVPPLGNTLSKVQAGSITQTLTPDPVSGFLTKAQEGDVTLTREYWPSGLPKKETLGQPGLDATASWGFTLGGRERTYTGVDGALRQTTRDPLGRLRQITDPDMQVTDPVYDPASRLTGWIVVASGGNYQLSTTLTLDDLGRETARSTVAGTLQGLGNGNGATWSQTQEWRDNDQLSSRTFYHGNSKVLAETFGYDNRNRLTTYTATGPQYPQDAQGRQISAQTFTYDGYSNITQCVTTFVDSTSDTATHQYTNPADPCQLTGITHTNPAAQTTLTYDAAGRLKTDDTGRTLTYDPLGRLTAAGAGSYGYDGQNRLLTQTTPDQHTSTFSYRGQTLAALTENNQTARLLHLGDTPVAQTRPTDSPPTRLLTTDTTHTIRLAASGTRQDTYAPTPYGQNPPHPTNILGYTGQYTDPITGCYHLGNGTRTYNPVLARFTTPDTLSPFGAGGINPYTYCLGDPINRIDPTGHLSWMAWLGIGLGVAGLALTIVTGGASIAAAGGLMAALSAASTTTLVVGALGVASDVTAIASGALEKASPKASSILGWVSLGTGIPGIAHAGVGLARAGVRLGRIAEQAPRLGTAAARDLESGTKGMGELTQPLGGRTFSDINPFFSERNAEGTRVWVSEYPVTGRHVDEIMGDVIRRGRKPIVLSGTHGSRFGTRSWDMRELRFLREDIHTKGNLTKEFSASEKLVQSTEIYDTSHLMQTPGSTTRILQGAPLDVAGGGHVEIEIVAAFCYSRNDKDVLNALGLEPTLNYNSSPEWQDWAFVPDSWLNM
ncbi:RHS repeat-associated core domain-containing protein [Streptomyces violascens]|uniref:RHS repeat-associated core domain-containing protein n=1 Tax=Streptomyces violascens TaxID=67381 RepID=UPI0036A79218